MENTKKTLDRLKGDLIIISKKDDDDGYNILLLTEVLKVAYKHVATFTYYELDSDLICILHSNDCSELEKMSDELNF